MKIVINNVTFDYNIGCSVLKAKHRTCPIKELEDIWEDIEPITFKEIAKKLTNLEQRRVAIGCLGIDKLVSEVNPKLIDKKTIKKETIWVNDKGELVDKKFNDTYELYEVTEKSLGIENNWNRDVKVHYVKCKDTSTDREYLIWVNADSIRRTNKTDKINAIQAVAWTIQTDIKEGDIKEIVRQGDCIMIKKKNKNVTPSTTRHLTEKEYRTLITAES